MTRRWFAALAAGFGSARSASVSVELALIANLVLVPLIIGAVDAAELATIRFRLDETIHEAMFFEWASGGTAATTGCVSGNATSCVQNAAAAAYGSTTPAPTISVSVTQYCITPATGYPTSGTPPTPSNGKCTDSSQIIETYMTVTSSVVVTLPFANWFVTSPFTMSVTSTARIQ
jgi:hypothetical protein